MLEKGFSINFLTKTRIDKNADNDELIELENDFYYPIETVFIGKNSSGKTTVICLLTNVISFIENGRMPRNVLDEENELSLDVIFYEKGFIYRYQGTFINDADDLSNKFLRIANETLQKTTNKASYKKDLSNIFFPKENLLTLNYNDTSSIKDFVDAGLTIMSGDALYSESTFSTLMYLSDGVFKSDVFNRVVRLFDDSIDYIKPYTENGEKRGYLFKRINKSRIIVSFDYLTKNLSAGTIRGIYIFISSLLAFKLGGTILIDEIEKSVNKNLVQNLLMLFNDKNINTRNATLIYSTHYGEILDDNERVDNINVLHRNGDVITIKNMCTDYNVDADVLKSNYFNQNAFDNLLNYQYLVELRRAITK